MDSNGWMVNANLRTFCDFQVQKILSNHHSDMVELKPEEEKLGGLIYPPPEIRTVADATARYVAKHGGPFEERIRIDKKHDQKFCFLNPNDPYRAYYDFKLKEAREGGAKASETDKGTEKPMEKKVEEKPLPKEPPAYDFISEMPHISAQDLDVLRLTALFVARNGLQFQTSLAHREQRNFQFDFLRPNHSLYSYYRSLVSQYVKVLAPPKPLMATLQTTLQNKYTVLQRISSRVEYEQFIADQRKKAEEEADLERMAHAMIDWHDFVVVETVEFVEADEVLQLPPPISIMDLEGLSLSQKRSNSLFPPSRENDAGDMDIEEDEENDGKASSQPPNRAGFSQSLPPRPQLPVMPRPPALGGPMPRLPAILQVVRLSGRLQSCQSHRLLSRVLVVRMRKAGMILRLSVRNLHSNSEPTVYDRL
ncbi:Pre-mRNA splicing factor PRP21 like protein-domain-containing protein [Chytridium lagenaria]|nr:Pre-mRNA splicing factor PRP21 like protein-domain-containing protein [Chytridium lagenaria]